MENGIKVGDVILISTAILLYELGIKTVVNDGAYLLIEKEDSNEDK